LFAELEDTVEVGKPFYDIDTSVTGGAAPPKQESTTPTESAPKQEAPKQEAPKKEAPKEVK